MSTNLAGPWGSDRIVELVPRLEAGDVLAEAQFESLCRGGVDFFIRRHSGTKDTRSIASEVLRLAIEAIQRREWASERIIGNLLALAVEVSDQKKLHRTPQTKVDKRRISVMCSTLSSYLSDRERDILDRFYTEMQEMRQICTELQTDETEVRAIISNAKALIRKIRQTPAVEVA